MSATTAPAPALAPALAPAPTHGPAAASTPRATAPTAAGTPAGTSDHRLSGVRGRVAARLSVATDGDAGMTTAEYAVGTVAACGFGGVLYKVITNDSVLNAIAKLIGKALTLTFG